MSDRDYVVVTEDVNQTIKGHVDEVVANVNAKHNGFMCASAAGASSQTLIYAFISCPAQHAEDLRAVMIVQMRSFLEERGCIPPLPTN